MSKALISINQHYPLDKLFHEHGFDTNAPAEWVEINIDGQSYETNRYDIFDGQDLTYVYYDEHNNTLIAIDNASDGYDQLGIHDSTETILYDALSNAGLVPAII